MSILSRSAFPVIIEQHVEAAMHLHGTWQLLLDAPHARLHQLARLDERLIALAEAVPGIVGAFGWVSSRHLRGVTKTLLDSPVPLRRAVGLQACAAHRVDPGGVIAAACSDADTALFIAFRDLGLRHISSPANTGPWPYQNAMAMDVEDIPASPWWMRFGRTVRMGATTAQTAVPHANAW
ncbi:hypothetical protein [Variovorax sp. AFSI2.2]|uniref:hypothetical protein n=1 Tax=Variovorax sp. AFSI2.2 TaxID=3384160 RepID=UPI003EBC226E